ncbi:MAG: protein-export rane protein SecD [Actinomycetia bacterium]|nr:protein-export rane protein SecD [Actinomycetes bacterium]
MAPPSRSAPHPWRALTGLIVILLVGLFSILGSATFSPAKWQQQFKVQLGLDLSSGTQVVLKAQPPGNKQPSAGEMQEAINVLLSRVNGTGNSGAQVQQEGPDLINVSVPGKAADQVINLISTTAQLRFRAVLLYEPYTGTSTQTPSAKPSGSATPSPSGSSSPSPTASGTPTAGTTPTPSSTATKAKTQAYIVRGAPAAAASASPSATGSASSTPKASSSATPTASASAAPTPTPTPTASASGPFGNPSAVNAATMKLFNKLKCTPGPNANTVDPSWKKAVGYTGANSATTYDNVSSQTVSCDASGGKYVLDKAVFEGGDITAVTTGLQQNSEQWVVDLSLNGKAQSAFGTLTTNQFNTYYSGYQSGNEDDAILDQTAVVLDGNVQSAPETDGAITAGQVEISGGGTTGFTQAQATQLANVLKYGALPLNFVQQDVSSISPQLGHDSLVAGLVAGIIGLILVIIYLFLYYRGLGLVSVFSLLIAALLAYLAVVLLSKYQNFTMELSGIAGLIVAIGITADSFIVFFERLRDEVREGKALRPAVESGWKRARRTIIVSDTVSFLAAVLLYHFAVSDVQGFAYTLGLTTLIDVLVVFTFTKPMVTLLAGTKFYGGGHKWSGLDPARLGARSPWRGGGGRRVVRTQRPTSASRPVTGSASGPSTSSTTSTEA